MRKGRGALTKLVVFLFASLIVVCNIHTGMGKEESVGSLRFFAAARGSAASLPEESSDDTHLQEQYDAAQAFFDAREYEKAYEAFQALNGFSDSRARASDSKKRWTEASYQEALALYEAEQYQEARAIFESLGDYKRSYSYVYNATLNMARAKYQQAKEMHAAGDYENAKALFESLGTFHDSEKRAQAAADMMLAQQQAEVELGFYEAALALKEAGDLEGARDAFIEAGECKDATDQVYAINGTLAVRAVYKRAEGYFTDGDYESAYDLFLALEDFENSAEKANRSKEAWQGSVYEQASALQSNDPSRAYVLFLFLGDYKDSADLADGLRAVTTEEEVYAVADAFAQEGDYAQAKAGFEAVSAYEDSQARVEKLSGDIQRKQDFKQALFLRTIGEEEQANALFKALGTFQNAAKMVAPVTPRFSAKQLRDDKTSPKSPVFTAPDGTRHYYQIYKGVTTWVKAKAFCEALGGHLATLTTEEENAFVYQFMRDSGYLSAYFGLSDEARKGNWEWVTGEPIVYTNWHEGEPSRSARERYGMYFFNHTDGTWNDSHFYEHWKSDPGWSFICEWDE